MLLGQRRDDPAEIVQRFDSLARFTEELRLRLARPLEYEADVAALSERSTGDVFEFGAQGHMDAPPEAAFPQVAERRRSGWPASWVRPESVHVVCRASQFRVDGSCSSRSALLQRTDGASRSSRNRPSLSYQLAQRFDEVRSNLGIGPEAAGLAQVDLDTAQKELLVLPLHALAAAGRNAVLLVDALDEAEGG